MTVSASRSNLILWVRVVWMMVMTTTSWMAPQAEAFVSLSRSLVHQPTRAVIVDRTSSLFPFPSSVGLASSATGDNNEPSSSSPPLRENDENTDVSSYVDEEKAKESLIQVAMIGVLALSVYNLGAMALASVYDTASSIMSVSGEDLLQFTGNAAAMAVQLLGALLKAIWQAAPVVGKAAVEGFQVAAPVVGQASQAFGEAASPLVQEASKQLGDVTAPYVDSMANAASPYIDSVSSAVDTAIVAPVQYAVGDLQAATGSVAGVVDSTMKGATESVASSIKDLNPFGH